MAWSSNLKIDRKPNYVVNSRWSLMISRVWIIDEERNMTSRKLFMEFVFVIVVLSTSYIAVVHTLFRIYGINCDVKQDMRTKFDGEVRIEAGLQSQEIPNLSSSVTFRKLHQITSEQCSSCEVSDDALPEVPYNFTSSQMRDHHVSLTIWKQTKPRMTSTDRRTVRQLLRLFREICTASNFTYFLISGSLLGSYRHHGILPWDDDVDILMPSSERGKIFQTFQTFAGNSPELGVSHGPSDRMKVFHKTEGGQVPIRGYYYRWPLLDITFYEENMTHLWQFNGSNILPKSVVFPLHLRPFETLQLHSPRDAFATLRHLYDDLDCVSLTYSHKYERKTFFARFNCKQIQYLYPFVHRNADGCCVVETLKLGDTVLYSARVNEPNYAISLPFKLALK